MSDILSRIPEGYTPGPWWINEYTGDIYADILGDDLVADDGVLIAQVEDEANLALILLAPELADECRRLTAEVARLRDAVTTYHKGGLIDRDMYSALVEQIDFILTTDTEEAEK